MRPRARLLTAAAVLIVLTELLGAIFATTALAPGSQPSLPFAPSNGASAGNGQSPHLAPLAGNSLPGGRRIGFWIADDDIFTTGSVYGLPSLPWTPQQFYDIYFNTPPYPATMLWATGLVSSGAASVPSDQEAQWLSQVASIADSHPNIVILMLMFVNLSGDSIETTVASHTACFRVDRVSPLTQFSVHNCLAANTQYTINLNDPNNAFVATIGTASTNSTGGFSAQLAIPNEPQNNGLWNIVVSGTSLSAQVALQSDQAAQLTSYMNNLKGHSSIYGALFEPEYFGDNPQIEATFRSIITGAGYQNLAGQTNANNDPILDYSSYPYFGGALDTVAQTNQVGVHYGETGQPIAPDPMPIWTQSTVTNIVDNSVPLPCTIIISANDVNNPAGNTYLWASPTLRGWIQSDSYYQANYVQAGGAAVTTSTTTSTSSTSPTSSTTTSSTTLGGSASGIVFSSYDPSVPFNYGQNFQSRGNSFTLQIPSTASVNMIAFYLSDRAYDPNPVPFSIVAPGGSVIATGVIPALLQYSSLAWYPIQLSQTVTLQANTPYTVQFANLPPGDTYGNAGISQDIIQQAQATQGTGYLGQAQWPLFEVGLMNLLSQSSGLAYRNYGPYTDLFASPGYQGNGEIAMRFYASQSEQLQTFEVYIWRSDNSANAVTFDLRPDLGGHPGQAGTTIASASLVANQAVASTFATVSFSSLPQLTAGTYYWIVMSSHSGTQPVVFGRLVNPYREYVLESHDDYATWGPPSDGPTDLGFRITTSGESIVNTVSGSDYHNYLSGIAQSFVPTASAQVSGAWVPAAPSGNAFTVSIQTDAGDKPSGTILAQGSDPINTQFYASEPFVFVGFTGSASVSPGTKYWLVVNVGPCLSSQGCSSPAVANTLDFRSDYSLSGFAPSSGTHYELLSGSSWTSTPNGAMTYLLVAPSAGTLPPTTTTTTSTSLTSSTSATSTSTTSTSVTTTSTTTTSSTTYSTTSTTSTSQSTSTAASTSSSTTAFLSSSSSYSSSSYSSPPSTASTTVASSTQPVTTSSTYTVATSTVTGQTTLPSTSTTWIPPSTTSTSATSSASLSTSQTQAPPTTSTSVTQGTSATVGRPSSTSTSSAPASAVTTDTTAISPSTSGAAGSGTSAVLYPSTSSLVVFSGTMGLLVVGLAVGVKLRSYRRQPSHPD